MPSGVTVVSPRPGRTRPAPVPGRPARPVPRRWRRWGDPDGPATVGRDGLRSLLVRLVRYAGVSAVSTAVSATVLAVLVSAGLVRPGPANVVATAVGTVPSFELNRRWVWGGGGRPRLMGQLVPFAALSFLGLGLSTLAVSLATGWAARSGWHGAGVTAVALTANLATFGTLWVGQYVVLDRLLFRHP